MSDDTAEATALATLDDHNAKIALAIEAISELSNELSDDLADKAITLAQLTQPGIKGMEVEQRSRIPQIYIRQPSSSSEVIPEDCKIGHLYDSNGETIGDSTTFIPILLHEVRKKWGEDKIDCQSLDGKTGSRYGQCSACPYGRYEQGVKTECSKGFSYFGVTEDLDKLYNIQFLKSSSKAGRNIKRLIAPPALWGKSFTISTEKISSNNRNYYEFKTAPTGRHTDADTMKLCDALHGFFQAQYHMALHRQEVFSKRLQSEEAVSGTVIEISDDSEAIDFSEGM